MAINSKLYYFLLVICVFAVCTMWLGTDASAGEGSFQIESGYSRYSVLTDSNLRDELGIWETALSLRFSTGKSTDRWTVNHWAFDIGIIVAGGSKVLEPKFDLDPGFLRLGTVLAVRSRFTDIPGFFAELTGTFSVHTLGSPFRKTIIYEFTGVAALAVNFMRSGIELPRVRASLGLAVLLNEGNYGSLKGDRRGSAGGVDLGFQLRLNLYQVGAVVSYGLIRYSLFCSLNFTFHI